MLFADYQRIQDTAGGVERVNCRINTKLCDRTGQYGGCIQVSEGACRSRVSQVVRRYIYSLYGGDGTGLGGGNTLLQSADVVCQSGLITYCGRHTAQQCGYFGTSLNETENVIDKEQYVLAANITEVFCHGQAGQTNAHTCSRRLVHLAINKSGLADNARFLHFAPQVVAFTSTLANACEYGIATVCSCDVMDQLHNNNGFAYAGAAEQTDFTAHCIRSDQVYDFNAGFQNFSRCCLLVEGRSRSVDGPVICCFNRSIVMVNGLAEHVEDTTQYAGAYGYADRSAGIYCFHAANQTIGGAHSNGTNYIVADVLHNFSGQVNFYLAVISGAIDVDCVQDSRHALRRELNVDNRANNLYDSTCIQGFSLPTN